jgi:hypothetical protein
MKLKIIAALSLTVIFSIVVCAQLLRPIHAEDCPISCPVTGPITEPITGPSESPSETPTPTNTPTPTITETPSPTTEPSVTPSESPTPTMTPTPTPTPGNFAISGNVNYKFFGFFVRGTIRPAQDVLIIAVNIFNHKTFTTHTDSNGDYVISPNESGLYDVHPRGSSVDFFAPPLRFVFDNQSSGKSHINFQGFIFRF